jgi:methyl-accepting chemotaxis protein
MIDLLRRISQCNRVFYLSLAMAAALLAAGVWGQMALAGTPAASAGQALLVFCVVTAVAGTALGLLIRLSIKAPVEDTVHAVIRIAKGDLETKVESPGRDELSWLRAELNSMRKGLRSLVLEVRESVQNVAAASEEIARGNGDLSSRTESQAGALQQTSSSMDQLADTVRSNAQHAEGARSEVHQTREVAERGGQIMEQVVQRMQDIHTSAARINDIIGVIDGIAFQTNILALNAAVEAARAGEHGRGFAVVASEVRSLAQRSAAAAREVKTLIGDSSEKVDAGTRLVGDAGQTMREILDRVARVSQIVSDIASAGGKQSDGIAQVHSAVAQIDDVTQQNAALVEQVAAASHSLKEQAARLSQTMGAFKVAG